MTHHIDSPAFIANWRLLRVILQPDNMDQMEDMKRLLQQVLLLPAAAWCRLATTGVYRPPDCPSIVDRTSSIHSFFLPDVHPTFPLTASDHLHVHTSPCRHPHCEYLTLLPAI